MKYEDLQDWHKAGECPVCKSNYVDFIGEETTGEGVIYYAQCCECGARFEEFYDLMFAGHMNIRPKEEQE